MNSVSEARTVVEETVSLAGIEIIIRHVEHGALVDSLGNHCFNVFACVHLG